MKAKDYMLRVQKAENELLRIRAKKQHYADLAMSIGAKVRTVVVASVDNGSKTETAAIGLAEMQEQLERKEKEYVALVKEAEALIEGLTQERFKDVLTLRYICMEKLVHDPGQTGLQGHQIRPQVQRVCPPGTSETVVTYADSDQITKGEEVMKC